MNVPMLLQMAMEGMPERVAVGSRASGLTVADLAERAARAAAYFRSSPAERIAMVDVNSEAFPVALFGAALAGKPFVPLNYRLPDDQLADLVRRTAPVLVIAGPGVAERLPAVEGADVVARKELLELTSAGAADPVEAAFVDPDDIAILLYTSGTTGTPKAAVLRHRNVAAYVLTTVEFAGADPEEAAIVSVPSYHIAGVSSVLSSTYGGRRVVYLETFEPVEWVETVRAEQVTHAMVVPTMLNRILDVVEADGAGLPTLRALSYGGGPMPAAVVERALRLLPHVDMVNAYGLTETSSTIALLTPEDHRAAVASTDPQVRARLGSVGRPLPTVEISIRDGDGLPVPVGEAGEIWVRGEQVSGEYLGVPGSVDDGWFRTRDAGHADEAGYLYLHGRLDDVIVRGGENLSPAEIEAVLVSHPAIAEAAVVGLPDTEWGETVAAVVVPADDGDVDVVELRDYVRDRLRSTKTPQHIDVRAALPHSETGKLLRRVLRAELTEKYAS